MTRSIMIVWWWRLIYPPILEIKNKMCKEIDNQYFTKLVS